jgi:hypothetical protein
MVVDYSKFDKIDCSDDDDSEPRCGSCGKKPYTVLRCSVCKKAVYCSQKCQREDWKFHKRNCQAPKQEDQSSTNAPRNAPGPSESSSTSPPKPRATEVEKLDTDDNLNWYRHREWQPSNKAEPGTFAPARITEPASVEEAPSSVQARSAWNKADTWEERDVTSHAGDWIRSHFEKTASIESIKDIDGFASITCVRGTVRYLFDLSFKFTLKGDHLGSTIEVSDFSTSSDLELRLTGPKTESAVRFAANLRPKLLAARDELVQYLSSI